MANKTPTSLTAASALGGTELWHAIQTGNSRKVTANQMKTYALAPFSANGLVARTAAETFSARTITGTAAEITVADGDGVSANPTLSLPTALTFTGKTVTGGTFNGTQVDTIEVGHASDTTLARSSAGNLSVEGNVLYRAGGTDVPLADGGTGASLADPNADGIMFWDDSAGAVTWLTPGLGLEISTTTLRRASGTSFPGTPTTGDIFWRSDRAIEYYYDGTQWLSTQLFVLQFAPESFSTNPITSASVNQRASNPWAALFAVYVETFQATTILTNATTSANYYTLQPLTGDGATPTNLGSAVSTQNDTQNVRTIHRTTINTVVASTIESLEVEITETGAATLYIMPSLTYRLVG